MTTIRDCSEIELENRKRNPEWFVEFEHRGLEAINENIRQEAIAEIKRREQDRKDAEAKRIAAIPPVDRTARVLTDGTPVTEDHKEILPSGQQKGYVVLSAEERAKGFVRPVRHSYIHTPCGSTTSMGNALAETYARDPYFYSGTFCCKCGTHFPLDQFKWTDGQPVGS
jgi:hypothetical protein